MLAAGLPGHPSDQPTSEGTLELDPGVGYKDVDEGKRDYRQQKGRVRRPMMAISVPNGSMARTSWTTSDPKMVAETPIPATISSSPNGDHAEVVGKPLSQGPTLGARQTMLNDPSIFCTNATTV